MQHYSWRDTTESTLEVCFSGGLYRQYWSFISWFLKLGLEKGKMGLTRYLQRMADRVRVFVFCHRWFFFPPNNVSFFLLCYNMNIMVKTITYQVGGQTWKALRPLGEQRQMTERWSTKSKACSAHGPKTNFNLEDKVGGSSRPTNWTQHVPSSPAQLSKCENGSMQDLYTIHWFLIAKIYLLPRFTENSIDQEDHGGGLVVNLCHIKKTLHHNNIHPIPGG